DGIRDKLVTGVQTCALPISNRRILSGRRTPGVVGRRYRHFRCSANGEGSHDPGGSMEQAVAPAPGPAGRRGGIVTLMSVGRPERSEERRVGKESRARTWQGE